MLQLTTERTGLYIAVFIEIYLELHVAIALNHS